MDPKTMVTPEELRDKLMKRIDALLARTLLVWGDDRALLSAMRSYLAVMPVPELEKMLTYYTGRSATPPRNKQTATALLRELAEIIDES